MTHRTVIRVSKHYALETQLTYYSIPGITHSIHINILSRIIFIIHQVPCHTHTTLLWQWIKLKSMNNDMHVQYCVPVVISGKVALEYAIKTYELSRHF